MAGGFHPRWHKAGMSGGCRGRRAAPSTRSSPGVRRQPHQKGVSRTLRGGRADEGMGTSGRSHRICWGARVGGGHAWRDFIPCLAPFLDDFPA